MNAKWIIIGILLVWLTVMVLDEFSYQWWRAVNPASIWRGFVVKHPEINAIQNEGYPNGYRPAGGQ